MSDKNYGLELYKLIMDGDKNGFPYADEFGWISTGGGILCMGKLSLA